MTPLPTSSPGTATPPLARPAASPGPLSPDAADTPAPPPPSPTVQSVDRALQLLALVAREGRITISDAARHLEIHRSSAMRLLNTLRAHELLSSGGAGDGYVLGQGLVRLAAAVPTEADFSARAQDAAVTAAQELNETVNVAVIQEGAVVTIAQANGDNLLGVTGRYVGRINPLHATSVGKLQLAAEPDASAAIAGIELTRFTDRTLTDRGALLAEIDRVRTQDWAAADEEWEDGMSAVAVPITSTGGTLIAAISTTAPSARLTPDAFSSMAEALRPYATALGSAADSGE